MIALHRIATLLTRAAAIAIAAAVVTPAAAQSWPSRPLKLLVPHSPGGVTDIYARMISQPLADALGQPVVVENRPGASGLLGTDLAAKAAPDGYTLLMFVDTNTIFPSLHRKLQHDPNTSFAAVTLLARGSHVLVAHPSVAANNLQEIIQHARQAPGELAFASPGTGSPQHLAGEIIKATAGINIVHIPYKGGGQAIGDVVGGQVKLGMLGMAPTLPHLRAGKLKAIAVTGATRSHVLPDTPTVAEQGMPGFETSQWTGMVVPAGTPQAAITRLHTEIARIMRAPAIVERVSAIGQEVAVSPTPEDFQRMILEETRRWPGVVKAAGIQPE